MEKEWLNIPSNGKSKSKKDINITLRNINFNESLPDNYDFDCDFSKDLNINLKPLYFIIGIFVIILSSIIYILLKF